MKKLVFCRTYNCILRNIILHNVLRNFFQVISISKTNLQEASQGNNGEDERDDDDDDDMEIDILH